MFGAKIATDFTGTADNCSVIARSAAPHEPSAKYLLVGEVPCVFLKSVKEDHIFTDQAYVSVIGQTAAGTKKMIRRFEYVSYPISQVRFETAGVGITDQDCELKFVMANQEFSIDLRKSEQENGIQIYRALTSLSIYQARNLSMMGPVTAAMNNRNLHLTVGKDELPTALATLNSAAMSDVVNLYNQMMPTSYLHIFNQYLG